MLRRTLLAGATFAALGLATALTSGAAQAQIKIGSAGPMTGEYASFGEQLRKGAEQAVADINAKGGVLGQQLVLSIGDDACDPKQAVSVANQFASQGVKFVAGHFCSGSSIPASKIYADEGILQITPASTNPKLTDEGDWNIFRTCGRDDQQGKVAGKFIVDHFKDKKLAILNDNSAYGKGLADETEKNVEALGMKPTLLLTYTPGEKDYSAIVSRLKEAGIEVIYIGGYHTETALITRQAKEQGMSPTVIGGDALNTKEFWQIAGDAGSGVEFTAGPDPRKRPENAAIVNEFKAKGYDPEGYTLFTYAAIQIWAEAATKAGTIDPRKVANELKTGGPFDSVVGSVTFDKKGDISAPAYVLYVWKNGNYDYAM